MTTPVPLIPQNNLGGFYLTTASGIDVGAAVSETGSGGNLTGSTLTLTGTIPASSSTVGTAVIGDGGAATTASIGGGNGNFGGALTTGGNITTSQSAQSTWTNKSTANGATLIIDGTQPILQYNVSGISAMLAYAQSAAIPWSLRDTASAQNPLSYTAGTTATNFFSLFGTLAANAAATTGAVVSSGSIAAVTFQAQTGFGVGALPNASTPVNISGTNAGPYGMTIDNTNPGALGLSLVSINNNTHALNLVMYGMGFTTSAPNIQDGTKVEGTGAGGLNIVANNATGAIGFYSGGQNNRGQISSAGVWTLGPTSNPTPNTFAPPIIYGRNNAAADNAGAIGESFSSVVAAIAAPATTTTGNVTSISPTAGKHSISGWGVIHGGSTGLTSGTAIQISITTTTGGTGVSGSTMTQESVLVLLANGLFAFELQPIPINIIATTPYYMTISMAYIAGSPTIDATLKSIREA